MNEIFTPSKHLSFDSIRTYLRGELGKELEYQIENHLIDCPLCSEAVEGYANHYNFDDDTKLLPQDLANKIMISKKTVILKPTYMWRNIAAALLLLVTVAAGWMYWDATGEERLFQAYYTPYYENSDIAMRGNSNSDPILQQAMSPCDNGDYTTCLANLKGLIKQQPENAHLSLLAGIAALEEGRMKEAINFLSTARMNDVELYEEASWHLALTYLKFNNKLDALNLLHELTKSKDSFYYDKALALIKELH